MLRINIHKNGDRLYASTTSNKTYLWEGESDFEDIDIPASTWKELLERLEWTGITDMSVLTFTDGNQVTMKAFRNLVADESVTLDKYVKQ